MAKATDAELIKEAKDLRAKGPTPEQWDFATLLGKVAARLETADKQIGNLLKYTKHTRDCNSHFIDSDLDRTCNTFGKCDCGLKETKARAEEILKP